MRFLKKRKANNRGLNHRIFHPKRARPSKFRARRVVILSMLLITLLFIGKIILGFYNIENVSFALFGNLHYTEGQIYDVLGENLDNIVIDSEYQTAIYLKENLSYLKNVQVSKNLAKRQLTIEVTERKVYARLEFFLLNPSEASKKQNFHKKPDDKRHFYLIDDKGYVLESIIPTQFKQTILIVDEGEHLPEIGKKMSTAATQTGIEILKHVRSKEPQLAKHLRKIDARIIQKITLHFENMHIPVWIAADSIKIGIRQVGLFVKQQAHRIQQNTMSEPSESVEPLVGTQEKTTHNNYKYIDARYEDTLYLGGDSN